MITTGQTCLLALAALVFGFWIIAITSAACVVLNPNLICRAILIFIEYTVYRLTS